MLILLALTLVGKIARQSILLKYHSRYPSGPPTNLCLQKYYGVFILAKMYYNNSKTVVFTRIHTLNNEICTL